MIWKESRIVKYTGRNSIKKQSSETRKYAKQSEAKKKLKICEGKHAFCSDKYSQKYFPSVSKIFPVLQQNSVFSLSGKSKNQIPCFLCAVATLNSFEKKENVPFFYRCRVRLARELTGLSSFN